MENFILTILFIVVIAVLVSRKQSNDNAHDERVHELEVEKVKAIQGIAAIMLLQGNTLDGDRVIGQAFAIDINTGVIERRQMVAINDLDSVERKQIRRQIAGGYLPAHVHNDNGKLLVEKWENATVDDLVQPLFMSANYRLSNGNSQP